MSSQHSPVQMRDVALIRSEGPMSSGRGRQIETPFGPSPSASQPSQALVQTAGRLPPASGPVFVQDHYELVHPSAAAGSFAPGSQDGFGESRSNEFHQTNYTLIQYGGR